MVYGGGGELLRDSAENEGLSVALGKNTPNDM